MASGTGGISREHVVQRLSVLFPSIDSHIVTGAVEDGYRLHAHHSNPDFVPLLVEETARDRLRGHLEAAAPRTAPATGFTDRARG